MRIDLVIRMSQEEGHCRCFDVTDAFTIKFLCVSFSTEAGHAD